MDRDDSLAFLETLLAHGPAGFAFLDRSFRFTRVSARLAEINGLPAEAHLGRTVQEVIGPEQWPSRRPLFERVMAGQAVVDADLPGRPIPNANSRRVLASYYPVMVREEIIGIAVVVHDTTDQARVEAALEQREREYRLLFDANPQPMWVYDTHTLQFLAVNDAAIQVYGYSRAEFLAMTLGDIRPAEDLPQVVRAVNTPRVGTRTDGPWEHRRKDRSPLWAEIAACSLDFHGHDARLIVAFDVTERFRMEQERLDAFQRQQIFVRDVLASVTDGKLLLSNTPAQLPPLLTPIGIPIPLTKTAGLWELRQCAREAAQNAGHSDERQHDLSTAASEAGMNAIVHAGGGTAQVSASETGTVQVRVEDQGTGITMENLPRATLAWGFSTASTLGHGLKMMLQTADRVCLLTGATGTTVVLEQDRVAPLQEW